MSKINKKELKNIFNQIKTDRKKGVEDLCSKYYKLIYGIAFSILKNKEDSEDAVQNFVTKLYSMDDKNLPKDKEATWLYTVAKNEALQILRKKKKELDIYSENIYEIENANDEIEKIIDKESFNKLISNLNNKEKEIVSLKIISDLSFSEISKLLEQPTSTIKWKYYRAVYKIKLLLENIAMLIITFSLGIIVIKSNLKKTSNKLETAGKQEDNTNNELNKTENLLNQSPLENEILGTDRVENNTSKDSTIIGNKEESMNNTINNSAIETNTITQSGNMNYIGIGMLCISAVFLIVTICTIFVSKFKLKAKKKPSK